MIPVWQSVSSTETTPTLSITWFFFQCSLNEAIPIPNLGALISPESMKSICVLVTLPGVLDNIQSINAQKNHKPVQVIFS